MLNDEEKKSVSSILGRWNLDQTPLSMDSFHNAFAEAATYGGDGSGVWIDGAIGFGHHLLFFTPESHFEKQPYQDGDLVITADARIDNRDELCERFNISVTERAFVPDSHLILDAYQLWGENCAAHLLGDFAFAIWDARKNSLYCARDHIGARPIFYYTTPQMFVFATDLRALKAFPDVNCELDDFEVATYLISTGTLNNRMLFKHLRRLPAGSYITLDETGLQQTTYWSAENVREVRYKTPGEYSEHFRALFNQAVAARVRTPYPVGAHNSGGLDSAGVAALANRELRRSGRSLTMTYTWSPAKSEAYPPVKHDERDDIEALCLQEAIPCHYGTATAQDFRDALAHDLAVETITPLYEEISVLHHAEGLGIRTILSGWGGDEAATFDGGGYLAQLLRQGRILRLAQITRREVGFRRPLRTLKFLYRRGIIPLLPSALYDRVHPYFRPEQRNRYLQPTFAARFPQVPALQLREVADVRKLQRSWLQNGHLAMRMELWALWSAPHRLVYTYPLTDRRILEFSIGLPPSLLYQQGEWRFLYRQAMNDTLPHDLNWKPNKTDVVNEQKRVENRMGCWQLWADEVRAGRWKEDDVYWLNMNRLRARLTSIPPQMKLTETLEFAGLAAAVRVWHLWHHYPNA